MMMIFSMVGRSILRSSRSRNVLRGVGGVRSAASTDVVGRLPLIGAIDHRPGVGGLGFLRGTYVASIGVHRDFVSKNDLLDLRYILPHPGIRRFFSNEAPKKKKEDSNADDRNKFREFLIELLKLHTMVLFFFFIFFEALGEQQQEISFEEFKNKLLGPGLVDHIDVSDNSVAKVYVKSSPLNQTSDDLVQSPATGAWARGNGAQYKFYFNIGSIESFEEKLVNAQEALGIDPYDYVPVTHVPWYQELGWFQPTFLLIGYLLMVWIALLG